MSLHFTQRNQAALLAAGLAATGSESWKADAVAVGAYGDQLHADLHAVAVFQSFDATSAEIHFGMIGAHRLGRETVEAITLMAFHPRAFNLDVAWLCVGEDNLAAQVFALKLGAAFEHRKRASAPRGRDVIVFSWKRRDTRPAPASPNAEIAASSAHEVR